MTERPYQTEARKALASFIADPSNKGRNPAVVLPTGAGKSFVIASCVKSWNRKRDGSKARFLILAHRKELVEQNSAELAGIFGDGDIGIYCAGLKRYDTDNQIVFASIDSSYAKADALGFFDCVIVDEAHRIPVRGEGKYRRLIAGLKLTNPSLVVVGFTATPFRLDSGPICGKDFILNEICYEAKTADLVRDGYLSELNSMVGDTPDLSGVAKRRGEFDERQVSSIMSDGKRVKDTVTNALQILDGQARKRCIWFCVNCDHADSVLAEIVSRGESARLITGNTPGAERDETVAAFRNGAFRHLLNVSVFTEGFNVRDIDAVILLRPTLSKALYWQMVGRGLRMAEGKKDCAILDFGGLIREHGPLTDGSPVTDAGLCFCKECGYEYSRVFDRCPKCGAERPKAAPKERDEVKANEYVRRTHGTHADGSVDILGRVSPVEKVDDVLLFVHRKPGKQPCLHVAWRCGLSLRHEYVCLWSDSEWARMKAERNFREIFGCVFGGETPDEIELMFGTMKADALKRTAAIEVRRDGKYFNVTKHIERI